MLPHVDLEQGLDDYLVNQVNNNVPPLDIIHGHLKTMMYDAQQHLEMCEEREEKSGEAIDSMDRTYAEGWCDALSAVYQLTYHLSFAIADLEE